MSNEPIGTYQCPVCGWDTPHSHTASELAERPAIDGARIAFEEHFQKWVAGNYSRFRNMGLTGFFWSYPARICNKDDGSWCQRESYNGAYKNHFVNEMWLFWRKAWLAAKGVLPTGEK